MGSWLQTPPGSYLLAWEQDRLDHAVTDAFGFHALQLGLPVIDALRANRMPHRWVASDSLLVADPLHLPPPDDASITTQALDQPVSLFCGAESLPFPNQSIDLVVLPHITCDDPRYIDFLLDFWFENFARRLAGRKLKNIVEPLRGY